MRTKKQLRVLCTKNSCGSDTEHNAEDHDVKILNDMMVPIMATMTLLLLAMLRRTDSMMLMLMVLVTVMMKKLAMMF